MLELLELLEGAQASIDELMHETAVALVEQLLVLSAQELAGAKQRGRDGGPVLWHGAQAGVVALAERQLRVQRPRLGSSGQRRGRSADCSPLQTTSSSAISDIRGRTAGRQSRERGCLNRISYPPAPMCTS